MKYTFTLLLLLALNVSFGQDTTYNRSAIDAQFGLNNPVAPMTENYDAATLNLFHVGLGYRYSFNTKFGFRLGLGYDNFRERAGTPEFSSDYYRVNLEGVANLGNIMDFQTWTRRIGLLFHLGGGYSMLNGSLLENPDHIMHMTFGFTPQVRLSERFSMYVDATAIANIYQNNTYDLRSKVDRHGLNGYLVNLSVGLQVALGKNARHADWAVLPNPAAEIESLQERLRKMEERQKDDDGDGVANYLDEEPGTPAGTMVDTKGRTITARDSDGDNIPDDVDNCPFEKGTPAMKGCPENRTGGAGTGNSSSATMALINQSEVKFVTDRADVSPSFKQMLTGIATVMKDNPSYKLNVTGHADDRASQEYNKGLSQQRAEAVKAYLVQSGIAADRITTNSVGESQPKAQGTTVEARAENRRVQFNLK